MASYMKLPSNPRRLDNIAELSLDTILSEYLSNSCFRDVFGNKMNQLIQFIHDRNLQDGFLERNIFFLSSDRHCLKDNLRNHINGYDMTVELITSGFQNGKLNQALNKEFLEELVYNKKIITETGSQKTYRITLKESLLDIIRLKDIGEDLGIALVERMKINGRIQIRIFVCDNEHYGSAFHLVNLVSITLGLSYFRLSEILMQSNPNIYKYGFGVRGISGEWYSCFDKIYKYNSYSVRWKKDTFHYRRVYDFLLRFYRSTENSNMLKSLQQFDPNKEINEIILY
jgi:hypothetical protein